MSSLRLGRVKVSAWRGLRGPWFHWEWSNADGVRWLNVSVAHPRKNAWWAVSVTVDF